jgi:hypothetical protein
MSSTYSTSLRIELIDTGTDAEAWGQPTDNNLGTIIEQAIVGSNTISLTNTTSYTLSTGNATVDQARNAVLVFNGSLTANCNVVAPSVNKVYIVKNGTSGGYAVNLKTSGGNGVQVAANTSQLVYCNGANFITAVNVNNVIGNLYVSGNVAVGNNASAANVVLSNTVTSVNGNLTLTSNTSSIVNLQQNTGALAPPSGSVAQRPSTPKVGMSRWNTDYGWYEVWNGVLWQQITGSFVASYLIVAGGGAGGTYSFSAAGGGGAGGMLTGTFGLSQSTNYSVVVGSGGTAGYFTGTNGANSSALGVTAIGGGYGAYGPSYGVGSGGSGGGGAAGYPVGSGTSGQGNSGGPGRGDPFRGGGGGGASAAGGDGNSGAGGIGTQSSITGTATYYAGGGGGGGCNAGGGQDATLPGAGGLGGGGLGGYGGPDGSGSVATSGVAGTANTGGGGGGAARVGQYGGTSGGAGGSGVVILSYVSPFQRATGGTITSYTSSGSTYWVHTFTSSGTFATY